MASSTIVELAERIRAAARVTVLTGAGISAASGVPTFRGAEGLWRQYRPEELATPDAFRRDPALVWEWYQWRRERVAACAPNAAHQVLARWTQGFPGCRVVTQNVDDLHVRAGTRELLRLHGSLWELACAAALLGQTPCASSGRRWRDERVPLPEGLPRCAQCGAPARPAVVWFGEPLEPATIDAARAATACDLFLTVGTSSVVYPAAGLVHEARRRGAFTVELNLEATPASGAVQLALHGPAERILPAVDAAIGDAPQRATDEAQT